MGRRTASARGRLIAVWVLLAGLAVMHVLPVPQACPEAMAGSRTVPVSAAMGAQNPAGMAAQPPEGRLVSFGTTVHMADSADSGMGGTPCVSTAPSTGVNALLGLLLLGLLCVAVPVLPRQRLATGQGPYRRGPPRFGHVLLHDLCVSRT